MKSSGLLCLKKVVRMPLALSGVHSAVTCGCTFGVLCRYRFARE